MPPFSPELDQQAIDLIRGMAMDAPLAASSGHQGTAMALAPLGHVLFSRIMRFDPADPDWPDRDRFVLSNGHASILQYTLLFLCGSGLELDDLKAFRQWGSRTPGHPERRHTPGIEVTTGPLGQGLADAVGMAIAERELRARFGADVQDHHTFAIAGDGCLQEGISHEAASLAGHLGLGHLVVVYDDNHVTIDGDTDALVIDDAAERFRAYGWHVMELGEIANDCDRLEAAVREAMAVEDRPSFLRLRSHIGYPSPDHTDDPEAHGLAFDADDVRRTKAVMGIPDEPFWAPPEIVDTYRAHAAARGTEARQAWEKRLAEWTGDRHAWDAALGRDGRAGLAGAAADLRGRHEAGDPPGHPEGAGRQLRHRPGAGGRGGRPHRQHRRQARRRASGSRPSTPTAGSCTSASASTPWAPASSAWPATAASSPSAARSSCSATTSSPRCASPR